MKFYCLTFFVLVVSLFANTKCNKLSDNSPRNDIQRIDQATNDKIQEQNVTEAQRLVKKEGWQILGLSKSKINKSRNLFKNGSSESLKMYWTWLKPDVEEGSLLIIDSNEFTKEERETLSIPEGNQVIVDIIKFDINDQPFCYVVKMHREGIGAIQAVHYYDEDGDGRFEIIQSGSALPSFVPKIPLWIKN